MHFDAHTARQTARLDALQVEVKKLRVVVYILCTLCALGLVEVAVRIVTFIQEA